MSDRFDDLFKKENQDNSPINTEDLEFSNPYINTEQSANDADDYSAKEVHKQPKAPDINTEYNNAQWGGADAYQLPYEQQYAQPYNGGFDNNYYNQNEEPIKKAEKKEKKPLTRGFVAAMLIVCILVSSVVGFASAMFFTKYEAGKLDISDNGALVVNKAEIDEKTAEKLADKSTSQITEEVADTVVEITTESVATGGFFGQYVSQGAGSGVIISTDGYIVTNNHVIEGASSIVVRLRDGSTYDAKLIGRDSVIDVALIKIEADNLKAATFGDSDKLKVGDKAVAIGNPLGQLGGTVTDGIISALDRDLVVGKETMSLLQTDTAINPGNSGGGLFDGQGQLVGVVVAKSSGEEVEGLGFAIPINDVLDVLDDLKKFGYVRGRVTTGMDLVDMQSPFYSSFLFGTSEAGCYVNSVDPESNAYAVGVRENDRIISVNSAEVNSVAEVEEALKDAKVGDVVEFGIERNGMTDVASITLEEDIPDDTSNAGSASEEYNPFS
ncbi:MAG: trypsin-like peptidase domain-containing protein [Ruminococcus sp.]|nr:trypsin-like peptidase domain-containing protein [Ruminococcus sp.]